MHVWVWTRSDRRHPQCTQCLPLCPESPRLSPPTTATRLQWRPRRLPGRHRHPQPRSRRPRYHLLTRLPRQPVLRRRRAQQLALPRRPPHRHTPDGDHPVHRRCRAPSARPARALRPPARRALIRGRRDAPHGPRYALRAGLGGLRGPQVASRLRERPHGHHRPCGCRRVPRPPQQHGRPVAHQRAAALRRAGRRHHPRGRPGLLEQSARVTAPRGPQPRRRHHGRRDPCSREIPGDGRGVRGRLLLPSRRPAQIRHQQGRGRGGQRSCQGR